MIPECTSKQVLMVGPDYRNHRGGVGALIASQKDHYEVFNFVPSYRPYSNNFLKTFFFIGQFIRILFVLINKRDIRIVHIHSSKSGSMYRKLCVAWTAKCLFGKKIINHIHTGNFKGFYEGSNRFNQRSIVYFLKLADATITVAESWKSYFESEFGLRNVHKVSNMVRLPNQQETFTPLTDRKLNFLFMGFLIDNKGIFDLVEVLSEFKPVLHGRIKLTIAGSGNEKRLTDMIIRLKVNDMIEFKGWVTGEAKNELLQDTDVYVLPSYFEGVPVSVLEAMSFSKPVIATNVGGIPEVVEHNGNGLLIRPGDHQAMLDAILFYVNDPLNVRRHGARSSVIIRNHVPDSVIPRLEDVYSSVLKENSVAWLH